MLSTRSILIVQIKSHLQQENKGQYSYMPLSSIQFSGCTSILVGAQKIQRLHKLIHASINTKKKLHPPKFSPPINIHQKFIPIQPSIHLISHSSSINFHHIHHASIHLTSHSSCINSSFQFYRMGRRSRGGGVPRLLGTAHRGVPVRRRRRWRGGGRGGGAGPGIDDESLWRRRRQRGPGGGDDS